MHTFIELLKYKWNAKGRHGIHSPFVYDLIEVVLQDRKKMMLSEARDHPEVSAKYAILFNRITQHYDYKDLLFLPTERKESATDSDVMIFPAKEPLLWVSLAANHFDRLKNDSAVFVVDIHKTAVHTHEWNRVRNHQRVLMSIDLYGVGLLFFREEFKEKQHFVLRY